MVCVLEILSSRYLLCGHKTAKGRRSRLEALIQRRVLQAKTEDGACMPVFFHGPLLGPGVACRHMNMDINLCWIISGRRAYQGLKLVLLRQTTGTGRTSGEGLNPGEMDQRTQGTLP